MRMGSCVIRLLTVSLTTSNKFAVLAKMSSMGVLVLNFVLAVTVIHYDICTKRKLIRNVLRHLIISTIYILRYKEEKVSLLLM